MYEKYLYVILMLHLWNHIHYDEFPNCLLFGKYVENSVNYYVNRKWQNHIGPSIQLKIIINRNSLYEWNGK